MLPPRRPLSLPRLALPPVPRSAARARQFVGQVAADRLDGEQADVVALLTSELAANAVAHSRTEFVVTVALTERTMRVAVADRSDELPVARPPWPGSVGGWGLLVLDRLSDRWGIETLDVGKRVWFELDLTEE